MWRLPLSLNDTQRFSIREMRKANPKMRYRAIAKMFGVSVTAVGNIINEVGMAPNVPVMRLPAVTPPSSFIRPIPLSRLMAGR